MFYNTLYNNIHTYIYKKNCEYNKFLLLRARFLAKELRYFAHIQKNKDILCFFFGGCLIYFQFNYSQIIHLTVYVLI